MDWRSQFEMFMPHGMCLLWRPELMSLHIVSDAMTALAYFAIPIGIYRFVRSRDDLERRHIALAWLFAAFIALCGLTHVVNIVVLWVPIYIIEGWLKALTAAASIATAFWLLTNIKEVIKLTSYQAMQAEVVARRESESELRDTRDDLRQSVALLSRVMEVVPGMVYAKDRAGRMLLANTAALDVLGKQWHELEGRTDSEFLANRQQAEIVMANDRGVLAAGEIQEMEEVVDHPLRGQRVYLSTKVPFQDGAGGGLVGFSVDITDRKRLAKEELHVARRTAMGDMAAAIAHEINQPLAAISMYLGGSVALLERDDYQGPLIESLATARVQCQRASEIIRRVRSFASGGDEVKRPQNLAAIIDEACSLALLGSRELGIDVRIEHASRDLMVLVDGLQIEQVVVNLVRNAIDAMGSSQAKSLGVTTGRDAKGTPMVSVSDSGPGISPEVVDRLFEPFVSTKGVQGMGVGLSICRTIVEGHGGKIRVDPRIGDRTIFSFTLPAVVPESAA